VIHSLHLAFRYVLYHRIRTGILLVCLSLAMFLPAAVHGLVDYYHRMMTQRADATPIAVGAPGSRYDLLLNSLYFKGRLRRMLTKADVQRVRDSGLAEAVPMYVRYTAGGHPIVGTSLDYFSFRGLRVREGSLPRVLGDVVLGAAAARRLNTGVGDRLLSDDEKLYDISSTYPLLMRVVGVLVETGTADDLAVFADIRTTWIIEGIGHGHLSVLEVTDPAMFRQVSPGSVTMTGAVVQYNEITEENLSSFHFHGSEDDFPVSSIIAWPRDAKSATILLGRYRAEEHSQAIQPRQVVDEIMDLVFGVERFFDAVFAVVLAFTILFLLLVMLLTYRLREREFETLRKIGCSRGTVLAVQAGEMLLLLAGSGALAAVLLALVMAGVRRFDLLL